MDDPKDGALHERRAALRAALTRRARAHARLQPARPRNGARHTTVELDAGGPTGILRIEIKNSALVIVNRDDQVAAREPLDLRLDQSFCWDDIICGDEEELADLLLVRAEHLLERLAR